MTFTPAEETPAEKTAEKPKENADSTALMKKALRDLPEEPVFSLLTFAKALWNLLTSETTLLL